MYVSILGLCSVKKQSNFWKAARMGDANELSVVLQQRGAIVTKCSVTAPYR